MAKKKKSTKAKSKAKKKSTYKPWTYENYLKNQRKKSNKKGKKRKTFKAPEGVPQDLWDTYRHLADDADKRLLRLEQLALDNPGGIYEGILSWAYNAAKKSIDHWDGDNYYDLPRFARNHPKTVEDIEKKTKDIIAFMEMKTSSKSGIDDFYRKQAEKLNETFSDELAMPLTWQEWAKFGARGYWDRRDSRVSYRELIRIGSDQKLMKKFIKPYKTMIGKRNAKKVLGKTAEEEIRKEFGLTREDMNLLKKAKDTIFEDDKSIVLKQAKEYMADHGLTYEKMFG